MSLIVTSSSQDEYSPSNINHTGIENPASYQNFLSSPLIIEPNSEIAVVSIKCNRDLDRIEIVEGEGLFIYWGYEKPDNFQDGGTTPIPMDDVHTPVRIELTPGTYSTDSFIKMLKDRLDAVVLKAFPEVKEIIVDEVVTQNDRLSIQFKQHGDGKGFTSHPLAAEYIPYISSSTEHGYYDLGTSHVVTEYTGNFVATDNASQTEVKITGYLASESTRVCDVIGSAHPVSRVTSKVVMGFNGSSAAGLADGYTLGFIRSQGGTVNGVQKNFSTIGGMYTETTPKLALPDAGVKVPAKYGTGIGTGGFPPFLFDIAFNWKNGEDAQVIHLVNDGSELAPDYQMKTITGSIAPTNSSLVANYYDRIEWEFSGETVSLYIGLTGKATREKILDGTVLPYGDRFKPLGQTCSALYPKIGIHNNDDTKPGVVDIKTYNGHAKTHYYENNFWGYQTLDEEITTSVPQDNLIRLLYEAIDFSTIYADGKVGGGAAVPAVLYVYQAELAGSAGVGNLWSLLFPEDSSEIEGDAIDYFLYQSQIDSLRYDNNDNLRRIMGFKDLLIQTEDSTVSNAGADVLFESVEDIQRVTAGSLSMFIRMKNQALNSYNANKRSISNILYACPRFDANGNTLGKLYFEPNERVYVKFNNISKEVMNSFDIDLVDVNEKVIENLTGNTVIVFHVRKSTD
tara:strand:+ start:652 stop:2694 length:2043 start_codon:yes stop_codon:yes gene_type:complete